ncbi:hypothetical protein AMELA_G00233190 [Ameiurus melas]|uniref:Uncharacterized protein n=1 Tax=Ameiurus melas TaxID=219545 RepID=A0A7J5ZXQ6_AMEME|nr:hypothetical protein AMELA_G00233190 [Ameiurus melas]
MQVSVSYNVRQREDRCLGEKSPFWRQNTATDHLYPHQPSTESKNNRYSISQNRTTHGDEKEFVDVMGSMVGPPQSLPPSSSSSSPDCPPPPEPSPAALPFPREQPPPIQQQPDDGDDDDDDDDDDDGDDPAVLANEPIQEVCGAPTQETEPASTCTHEAEKVILENADKCRRAEKRRGMRRRSKAIRPSWEVKEHLTLPTSDTVWPGPGR